MQLSIAFPILLWSLALAASTSAEHTSPIHSFGRIRRLPSHASHHSHGASASPKLSAQHQPLFFNLLRRSQRHSQTSGSSRRCSSESRKLHGHPKTGDGGNSANSTSTSSGKRPHGHRKAQGDDTGLAGLTFDGPCPDPNASDSHPNGDINFLDCGISKDDPSDGHWSPPNVSMDQLQFASLEQANESGVFDECKPYDDIFQSASDDNDVPAILLMSFAMQESSCRPWITGENGEIGLMQLTKDKCTDADCYDAQTNVDIAAKYFRSQLDKYDGNVLQAIGTYNGWFKGMTYDQATDEQYGCYAQRNLDYLNQVLNGYCQAKDGSKMLVYNNLGHC